MYDNLYQLVKDLRLGIILYRFYYAPKGFIQKCLRQGSINMAIDYQARQQMERAAYRLKPVESDALAKPLEIHFLSGRKFWYQTCFCAYSMAQHAKTNLCPVIYDDGSLEKKYQDEILRIFPNARIILKQEIQERLEEYLPQSKFPYLRERRLNYPNMKKLTDIHAGLSGWKLVLDSDMLFFRSPTFLLNWLKSPEQPCYMVDVETSYGYSDALMTSLTGVEIPERLNVGICGLRSEDIDWEQLEYWCKTLIGQEGTHYYQEQALTMMLMAGKPCAIAPAQDYVVMPKREEVIHPQGILHHYVADSKRWYFRYGWKHVFQSERQLNTMIQVS
jgi:ferredoxin-thioredoxin reductase catalytic subunit